MERTWPAVRVEAGADTRSGANDWEAAKTRTYNMRAGVIQSVEEE